MKKVLAISLVLLGLVFLAGCGQQSVSQIQSTPPSSVAQTPAQLVATQQSTTQPIDETANWQIHQNEKFGIEFKYPKNIQFDNGNESGNGWYTVAGNYDYSGDNYFNFTVLDKTEGMENIKALD